MNQETKKPILDLKKVYLKDVSFESPNSPQIFTNEHLDNPSIDVQLSMSQRKLNTQDTHYEIVLHITLTVNTTIDDKEMALYLCEVQQAGIFELSHPDEKAIEGMMSVTCPTILFPFAREEVHALIGKGGFPQVLLNPVNFEALYQQKLQEKSEANTSQSIN